MNNLKVNINNVQEFKLNNQETQIYEVIKNRNNINNNLKFTKNNDVILPPYNIIKNKIDTNNTNNTAILKTIDSTKWNNK